MRYLPFRPPDGAPGWPFIVPALSAHGLHAEHALRAAPGPRDASAGKARDVTFELSVGRVAIGTLRSAPANKPRKEEPSR